MICHQALFSVAGNLKNFSFMGPGSVPAQVGWGLEQPGLVVDVLACGRALELDRL